MKQLTDEAKEQLTNAREQLDNFEITRAEYEAVKAIILENVALQAELVME